MTKEQKKKVIALCKANSAQRAAKVSMASALRDLLSAVMENSALLTHVAKSLESKQDDSGY